MKKPSTTMNMLRGAATLLAISPRPAAARYVRAIEPFYRPHATITEALRADWEQLGKYFPQSDINEVTDNSDTNLTTTTEAENSSTVFSELAALIERREIRVFETGPLAPLIRPHVKHDKATLQVVTRDEEGNIISHEPEPNANVRKPS